jgi:hypothetical protein
MRHQAAMPTCECLREGARHDGGCRGREDRVGRRQAVELGKDRALEVEALRQVLLNEGGAGKRIGEIRGDAHALRRGGGVIQEPVMRELIQTVRDESARRRGHAGNAVVERDVEPAARKHDCPRTADQPRSNDGDAHGSSP